jgi:L-alanine-DL-glutamate epimerase-like enolase superfamily enzyme
MIMPLSQLKEIVAAGASITVDATTMTLGDLKQLATGAAMSNAQITIKNVGGMTHDHLKQIAALAPGHIALDLM